MSTRFLLRALIWSLLLSLLAYASTYFVSMRYSSEVQFFVPLMFSEKQAEQSGVGFGGDAEIDAHIQILRSATMERVLENHYPNQRIFLNASRTRYGAVSLVATTPSSELSAKVANKSVALADSLKQALLLENRKQSLGFLHNAVNEKNKEVVYYQNKLDSTRKALADARSEDALAFRYERLYGEAVNELARYTTQLRRAEITLDSAPPSAYVFSRGMENKAVVYPNRWVVSLGVLIMAFIFQLFLRTMKESI